VALDIFLVRKLGLPGQPELAMGAIASGGVRVLNEDVVGGLSIPAAVIDRVAQHEQEELERRERAYREGRPALVVEGRTLILVDDGLATGSTMRAAALALRLDCPIFVDDMVLKSSKLTATVSDKVNTDELRRWLENLNDEDMGRYKM
jgi:predicted phosphoribosyltransferase